MDLASKISTYLAGDPTISDEIVYKAGQMFNSKLGKFNFRRKGGAKLPSMSQVGKPFCQLHAEKLGWPKHPESNSFRIKMLYGDMTEVIAVAILLAAGVEIVDLNKKVGYTTNDGDQINGEYDLVIKDGNGFSLWDIKSASKFAFEKKFASYDALKNNDDFGYCSQLFGYTKAERADKPEIKAGGWIAISKETGDIKVVEADPDDEEMYTDGIEATINRYKKADENNFVRNFEDEEEFFYRKPTGNRKLKMACSYCSFRYTCWPDLRYERNPKSKSANAYNYYTVFN